MRLRGITLPADCLAGRSSGRRTWDVSGQEAKLEPAVCSGGCEGHLYPGLYELASQLKDRIFTSGLALTSLHQDTARS